MTLSGFLENSVIVVPFMEKNLDNDVIVRVYMQQPLPCNDILLVCACACMLISRNL